MNIYQTGNADNLTDPQFFTRSIHIYQQAEKELLQSLAQPFETIIEAGCTKGRYTAAMTTAGKNYIGIDIASHHIADASLIHEDNDRAVFFCSDIHNLSAILSVTRIPIEQSLLVFPFNMFGNIKEAYEMLQQAKDLNVRFIIFTYATDEMATRERADYYRACGFEDIQTTDEAEGIRFTNDAGLDTIAYRSEWFLERFQGIELAYHCRSFGDIGLAYFNF